MSEGHDPTPSRFIEGSGKLRNGLYLRGIRVLEDRVTFDVFASRPIGVAELADLSLTDDAGTQYSMVYPDPPYSMGEGASTFSLLFLAVPSSVWRGLAGGS